MALELYEEVRLLPEYISRTGQPDDVDEISEAIRLECEIAAEIDPLEEWPLEEEFSISQLELSEIAEDRLLLCPYCRVSNMYLLTGRGEKAIYGCDHCQRCIEISGDVRYTMELYQLRDWLAGTFSRHKQTCHGHPDTPYPTVPSVDASLTFEQNPDGTLLAYCELCGFGNSISLSS